MLRLRNLALDSDSSSDEDERPSIAAAYKSIDIRRGLLDPLLYPTAVQELNSIISALYKGREFTKEARKLIEADVQTAINEFNG